MSTEPSREAKGSSSSDAKVPQQDEPRLPFEPRTKRKKAPKSQPAPTSSKKATEKENSQPLKATKKQNTQTVSNESTSIPEVVSKRMARRMALFSGAPTVLGMATFVISYVLVTKVGVKLPNVAVVLVSMGFFGLGVLGLTYGVLSASWDEDVLGTKLGWPEFKTNLGRMTAAWRSARQKD